MARRTPDPEQVAVAVIGAGAAGVSAARAAAATLQATGGRVVLIGDERPGGGSRLVADGGALLDCAARGLDWHATLAHLRTVRVEIENRSREAVLRADGVDLLPGRARLLGGGRLAIETAAGSASSVPALLAARRIVVATGDEDRLPEVSGLGETAYLTVGSLLRLGELPPSMVVLGGGPHGCELAQALARFGVNVTLIEGSDRLLPSEPPEVSGLVTAALREDGVRVFTGAPAVKVAPTLDGGAWVGTGAGGDVAAEGLLLATGRRANVRDLDLPAAGVALVDGWIRVDERLATTGAGVLATGRVTGLLPHGTSDPVMARVAGVNAAARRARSTWTARGLPRVVRTEPSVAAVGISPDRAGAVTGARVSGLPYRAFDRALLSDRPGGVVTLVAGPPRTARFGGAFGGRADAASCVLLGASIIGPQAGELAGIAAVALQSGMTVEQLARAPLSSRTFGVALQHAAAGFASAE